MRLRLKFSLAESLSIGVDKIDNLLSREEGSDIALKQLGVLIISIFLLYGS
jgi:hypothetical protein